MLRKLIILIFLGCLFSLSAYEWSEFGMDSGVINNYCFPMTGNYGEIICASDGFYSYEINGWMLHSYGLPVWDVCADESGNGDLIVIMGDGSYSDGVYLYTFDISEFIVLHWFMEPEFLLKDETTGKYFVGGTSGLISSEDGIIWNEEPFFNGVDCHAMAIYEGNYVVSANEYDIYISNDYGESWDSALQTIWITDMSYDQDGTLFGVFPDMSWSSGLWSSDDHGNTWQVEFWEIMINCVYTYWNDYVFVGWKDGMTCVGLASWQPGEGALNFYNSGLYNYNINKITTHPYIDCDNIICCTDNGSYMLTNFGDTSAEEEIPVQKVNFTNFPNPFNPSTVISFQVSGVSGQNDVELTIYNVKGQEVRKYSISNDQYSITWDGKDNKNEPVPTGIYLAKLKSGEKVFQRKLTLLK